MNYPKLAGFHCLLKKSAMDFPNNVLMHFPEIDKKFTFYETSYNVDILSNAFIKEFGVKKGDGIAIMTPNCPEYIFTVYASGQCGGILIPINPLLKKKEVKHILDTAGNVKVLIVNSLLYGTAKRASKEAGIEHIIKISSEDPKEVTIQSLLDDYPAEAPDVEIDIKEDLGALLFTGGTTGLPKGVMITHSNIIANSFQFLYTGVSGSWQGSTEATLEELGNLRSLTANPLCHGMGFFVLNSCVLGVVSLIIYSRFNAGELLKMIEKYKLRTFSGVPTMFNFIINHPDFKTRDLSSLEMCGAGAAPLPPKVAKIWKNRTGLKVVNAYGLTEVTCMCTCAHDWTEINPESISFPIIDTDAKIVKPPDYITELEPGERGELLIRGPQVMKGYWQNPEATKNNLIEDENGNIWVRSGDIAIMDENGFFYIVGRSKEMIKYKGYRILPAEVEDSLFEHPAVLECAVIGVPDPEEIVGEYVKAFIKLKAEYENKITEQKIKAWAKENMAGYKWPRMIEFVSMIPKSPVGKTMRRKLLKKELKKREENK
ncbi:MAG: AMP-binding protein [Candidatus Lokiarchaeota archaeon]|nr:AMP-binding protein [Candidatus Lokiarchaeota archaeon]